MGFIEAIKRFTESGSIFGRILFPSESPIALPSPKYPTILMSSEAAKKKVVPTEASKSSVPVTDPSARIMEVDAPQRYKAPAPVKKGTSAYYIESRINDNDNSLY
ncbi:unnamed protein product [Caenorhabditis nigoni]